MAFGHNTQTGCDFSLTEVLPVPVIHPEPCRRCDQFIQPGDVELADSSGFTMDEIVPGDEPGMAVAAALPS
jgi:hypothetical protein